MLPFIIAGITTGSVYGLAGVGLVLTYKTTKILNFAYGAFATLSAYMFYTLNVQHNIAWPIAALITLIVTGPVLGLLMELVGRAIAKATLALQVAATVGILLMVEGGVTLIYGTVETRSVPPFLGSSLFHVAGTTITQTQLTIAVIALMATVGLYVFFRIARTGVAMRAVVNNPDLLDLAGTSSRGTRRWSWCIGVTFASASGLLLAPLILLNATTLTLLVVTAFGAAAIGGFTNLPLTYVGGLVIGVLAALSSKYFTNGLFSNLAPALPFVVLFLVLLLAPKRRLFKSPPVIQRAPTRWVAPPAIPLAGSALLVIFLCFVPSFVGVHLTDWTLFLSGTILFLSLGLLVRTSGQVSLCQLTFSAIGAAAFSQFAAHDGIPWLISILLAGLVVVPIGVLLAIPAIRHSGIYLALATFGFGVVVALMFYNQTYMFGPLGLGLKEPRPHLSWITLDSAKGYYYVVLVFAVVATIGVIALTRTRLGRLLRALADSPNGLATAGASTQVTRVAVFAISVFLAGVAGALAGGALQIVTGDDYQPLVSLLYFAVIVIVIGEAPWYAVLASAGVFLIPSYLTSPNTANWLDVLFGVVALLFALTPESTRSIPVSLTHRLDHLGRRKKSAATMTESDISDVGRVEDASLKICDLCVRFGGVKAVDEVSLLARTGKITGLIGPNGAGKTTTFNVCSGLANPSSGQVLFNGRNITGHSAAQRARNGLGRTFQQMELYDTMTVRENVELGLEASFAGPNPLSHVMAEPSQKRRSVQSAKHAMKLCKVDDLAYRSAGSLSTGERRLVELARCLAGPYRLILLDEPSSGLDRRETKQFGRILRQVVSERGLGVLIVEHDMQLVNEICDYIYVLDFGRLIFEGTPHDVMSSESVQAAYLGTDASGQVEAAAGQGGSG